MDNSMTRSSFHAARFATINAPCVKEYSRIDRLAGLQSSLAVRSTEYRLDLFACGRLGHRSVLAPLKRNEPALSWATDQAKLSN